MNKLSHTDLVALIGEDNALYMNTLKNELVLLIATGQVDAMQTAKEQMANRGLGANGEWIGFAAAKELWLGK